MKISYDVDTQNDFMNKNGALYVPDAELIKPNLRLLTDFARKNFVPIVGSVDSHPENDPEFKVFPPHCIKKTNGELKIPETTVYTSGHGLYTSEDRVMDKGRYLANLKDIAKSSELEKGKARLNNLIYELKNHDPKNMKNMRPIYFEKQSYDVFTNPAFPAFLEQININEAVVYGVATDYCVKAAVLGMQQRGVQCYVVEDAIKGVFPDKSKEALEEMVNAGAKLITTKQVLEGKIK